MYNHRMSAIPWVTMLVASVAADYTNPIPQPGEPGYRPTPKHHLRVLFENDSAFDEDCNYSHGTRIDYAQAISENRYYGLSIVQNIYTPEYHTNGNVYGQQPYAGYLALGALNCSWVPSVSLPSQRTLSGLCMKLPEWSSGMVGEISWLLR